MALLYAIQKLGRGTLGNLWVRLVDITFDNAYPTGGWALTPASLGIGSTGQILFVDISGGKAGVVLEYDQVNGKIKAYQNAAGAGLLAELANNSAALNGVTVRALCMGVGSPG